MRRLFIAAVALTQTRAWRTLARVAFAMLLLALTSCSSAQLEQAGRRVLDVAKCTGAAALARCSSSGDRASTLLCIANSARECVARRADE